MYFLFTIIDISVSRVHGQRYDLLNNPASMSVLVQKTTEMFEKKILGNIIDTITDVAGNVVDRMSIDAFCKRRQGNWRADDGMTQLFAGLTYRGFIGHEHMDEIGLINMNGRCTIRSWAGS